MPRLNCRQCWICPLNNGGARPLIKPDTPDMDHLDLALKEIAESKLSAELGALPTPKAELTRSLLAL